MNNVITPDLYKRAAIAAKPLMGTKAIDTDLLTKTLRDNFPDIAFAYLFGSSQDGAKPGSDIDIAIYYKGKDIFIRMEVAKQLEEVLGTTAPIDIVELRKTENRILAFEALRGKLLFVREEDKEEYINFYTRTCRLYEDEIYWMKKQLEYRGYEVQWSH
ncbi:MAG: nucleotidyltransferase domain-containing protein [Bacteroidales bacterium]